MKDAIGDVSTTPQYFVRVAGSKAIETGIQQMTTRKRAGVESRSVSASYYVLVSLSDTSHPPVRAWRITKADPMDEIGEVVEVDLV